MRPDKTGTAVCYFHEVVGFLP